MITIRYTNTGGYAFSAAVDGLSDLWATIDMKDEVQITGIDQTTEELLGEYLDDKGVPTGRPFRRSLNQITFIEI
jgi:hypothetical protein